MAVDSALKPTSPQLTELYPATGLPTSSVAPGSLVTIRGSELAIQQVEATAVPLPLSLGSASVSFNGIPAPLMFVNENQINAQVPWNVLPEGITSGTAELVATNQGISTIPQTVKIGLFSPGIFTLQFGVGQAVAINSDGTLAAPTGSVPGLVTHPAAVGDPLLILGSGLGAVTPAIADGANATDGLRTNTTRPGVLIGGIPATVSFSGLSPQFAGVNQINVTVPSGVPAGDVVPLQIRVGGITTSDKVTIAIRP